MAGEMERDARLILRAEDRASKTFDQVAASIKRVRQEIADQSKAVQEGRGDLGAYNKALDELKAAGDDLVKGQSLIRQFEAQGETIKKAEDRLQSATAALDAYRKKAGDSPTDNQALQIEKKVTAVTTAQAKLEQAQQRLGQIEGRMAAAGIATNNLEQQFNQMGSAAVEAAQGIAAAKNAINDYPNAVKRAAAAAEEFQAAQALSGRNVNALPADDFAFVQSLDTAKAKLEAIGQIEARQAAEARSYMAAQRERWALQLRSLKEEERRLLDVAQASKVAESAEKKRLADLTAFRQQGIDAAESAVKVERYAASVQNLGNDFQSFSQQVRGALGGTSSSLQDIGQAIKQIDASAETLAKPKARINELQESTGQLSIAIATLDRTARQIDGFRQIQSDVQRAEAVFGEAQAEVLRLAAAVGKADEPVEALDRELAQAQQTLARAGREMQQTRNKAVEMGAGLRKAGIDADNLDAEMVRLQTSATRAGTTFQGLSGKTRGRGGFLGLNAFEMQNLGYQVNDVFTQLGSGTPILQVLAQQGPQIIQLFQGLGTTLLRFTPIIGGVLLLLSPFIGALVQASRATDALREANVLLAGTGEQTKNALGAYTEAGIQLRNLGVDAKGAKAALEEFHRAGLDPAGLTAYSQALADANKGGHDVTETSKLLAEALAGGAEQVQALNDKFNILTPAEETQIVKMIESGQESEARRILFEKFSKTSQDIADKSQGPWSKAWGTLTNAFNNWTRAISNSAPFRNLGKWLDWIRDKITGAMEDIAFFLNYASKRGIIGTVKDAFTGPTGPNGTASAEQRAAAQFASRRGRAKDTPFPTAAQNDTLAGERAIRKLTAAQEEQRGSLKKLSREQTAAAARRKALADAQGSPEQRKRQADIAEEIALASYDDKAAKAAAAAAKRNKKKGDSDANKAKRAAEALARERLSIEEQLVRDLDTLEAKVDKNNLTSIEERRAAIEKGYTGLFQKIDEFRKKGGTKIEGVSVAEYEKQVRAQINILANLDQMKGYEESINATLKDRADQIKAVEDALDRGDISASDATAQVGEIVSRFAPQVSKLASDAITFARSLRTATPDPKLEAFISKFERITQQNSGGQDRTLVKNFAQGAVDDEARKLDQLIQQRDALVAAENTLVELGVKSRTAAQGAIEAAYARTTPLIQQQSAVLQDLLKQFVTAYPEMQTFYDTWQAKLQGIAATSDYVSPRFTQLKTGIDGIVSGNAVAGIDSIAQALSRLALGQQGAMRTLKDLGLAFANFIAETLIGISKLIIQMVILSAVEKATGIPVGALLKLMNASGLHTGGIAGQERTFSRRVPEAAFYGAPRYHGGGLAGFAPDEVPAILKRNEEVLDESDPRHRFNLGGSEPAPAGAGGAMRNILVMDPKELANAMAGPAGERMVISHIRRNADTVAQMTSKKG